LTAFPPASQRRLSHPFPSINCLSSFLPLLPSHILISSRHVHQISIPSRKGCRHCTSSIVSMRLDPPPLTRLSACPPLCLRGRRKVNLQHPPLLWCRRRCWFRWLHVLTACPGRGPARQQERERCLRPARLKDRGEQHSRKGCRPLQVLHRR
jgi:hypothetical protein